MLMVPPDIEIPAVLFAIGENFRGQLRRWLQVVSEGHESEINLIYYAGTTLAHMPHAYIDYVTYSQNGSRRVPRRHENSIIIEIQGNDVVFDVMIRHGTENCRFSISDPGLFEELAVLAERITRAAN